MTPREAFVAFMQVEGRFGNDRSPLCLVLEALIVQGEQVIDRLNAMGPDVPMGSPKVLLERALEAHGVNASDPLVSGVAALEADLWALRCSVVDTLTEKRFADALDRLAQRAGLLVTMATGGAK